MKYPRFNSIEELKNFGLSMDEVQIFSDIDPNNGKTEDFAGEGMEQYARFLSH